MNTVDALADAGGKAANFLDTGGKATSETVKKSFQAILQDDRVKVIFVNIFGGLTCQCLFYSPISKTAYFKLSNFRRRLKSTKKSHTL